MKRMLSRIGTLLVLLGTGCFLYASSPVAVLSCWEQAYNKWMGCDGGYFNTKYQYQDRTGYCTNTAAGACSSSTQASCNTHATNACSSDPDPVACYNYAYNTCYSTQYPACYDATEYNCLLSITNTYNNRGNAYSSCLGMEGNYGNCVEEVEFSCSEAQSRSAACLSAYADSEDYSAYSTCVANSGINQCQ